MNFQYLEIRPCIQVGDHVTSFASFEELEEYREEKGCEPDFWTLYGRDEEGLAHAIGDFDSYEAVVAIKDALLAPMGKAREALDDGSTIGATPEMLINAIDEASSILTDFLLQTSDGERL